MLTKWILQVLNVYSTSLKIQTAVLGVCFFFFETISMLKHVQGPENESLARDELISISSAALASWLCCAWNRGTRCLINLCKHQLGCLQKFHKVVTELGYLCNSVQMFDSCCPRSIIHIVFFKENFTLVFHCPISIDF